MLFSVSRLYCVTSRHGAFFRVICLFRGYLYKGISHPSSVISHPSPSHLSLGTMNFLRSKAARARKIPTLPAPPPDGSLRVLQVDFAQYGFPELSSRTCIIIDNLLTPDDVDKLYTSAVSSSEWTAAEVHVGGGLQVLATDYRNSGRIILDSHELAGWLFEKIEPHLPAHVVSIPKALHHAQIRSPAYKEAKEQSDEGVLDTNNAKPKEPVAKCTRLNERLRFLRYEEGMFFNPHYDGQYWTPDKKEVSYYTLQVYLSGEQNEGESQLPDNWRHVVTTDGGCRVTRRWRHSYLWKRSISSRMVNSRTGCALNQSSHQVIATYLSTQVQPISTSNPSQGASLSSSRTVFHILAKR